MLKIDPIRHFLAQTGYNAQEVQGLAIGKKYLALKLRSGKIGVCATLGRSFPEDYSHFREPDPGDPCDRIFLNAWINARLNYSNTFSDHRDIFDLVDFKKSDRIVMVGYFAPLIQKFQKAGITVDIFDLHDDMPGLTPVGRQKEKIAQAEKLILTSTSIANESFLQILAGIHTDTNVYLLGPSTILHPDMYKYAGISKLFGTVFKDHADEVLKVVGEGQGTPSFSKYGWKVYL